jgi:hypothetical protein
MTTDARTEPHQITPLDPDGNLVDGGVYAVAVDDGGRTAGLLPAFRPNGGNAGEGLAKVSSGDMDAEWITGSVPTVLLPAGSTAADMATYAPNAPYGTIVRIKA